MLPIQFILLLILASLPGQLAQGTEAASTAAKATIAFPLVWVLTLILSHIAAVVVVWVKTRRAIRMLYATSASSSSITQETDGLFFWARWLTVVVTGLHLFATPVGGYVTQQFSQTYLLKNLLVPELVFVTPALLAWLAIWAASYYVELAVRERSLPYRLAQQLPVHEMPSLGHYFLTQARHNFFPALFLLAGAVINLTTELVLGRWFPALKDSHVAQGVASALGTGMMLVILPILLVRIWSTTPLRGGLRERLDRVAGAYKLRFRNILLWRTHNLTINAAILGWLPFSRYFLLSDSLLESFSDRQLEAVFAHEVGHGVHRHLHWFLAVGAGVLALVWGIPNIVVYYLPSLAAHQDVAQLIMSAVLLLVFGGLSIPFISPRFEHQADWFASRHMARVLAQSPEAGVAPMPALPVELQNSLTSIPTAAEIVTMPQYMAGGYPHATSAAPATGGAGERKVTIEMPLAENAAVSGAEVFISALDGIVEATHRDRRRRGLMHPSIEDRIRLLRRMAVSPELEAQFNRAMRRTRYYIVALVAAGVASCLLAGVLASREAAAAKAAATMVAPG